MFTLPIIFFLASLVLFASKKNDFREAFLLSTISFGVVVVIVTEMLSLLSFISILPLATSWCAAIIFIVYIFLQKDEKPCLSLKVERPSLVEGFLMVCIAVPALTTFVIAISSVPNNWDSMTYHMSRVMHWMQHKCVAHYPTHIDRQVYQSPFAEYIILHLLTLTPRADFLANFVQWFAYGGNCIVASLLASQLGCKRGGQLLAAAFAASVPMAILQASGTQNDLVVAFWLGVFVYFALKGMNRSSVLIDVASALALSLAILTKPTAYFFAFPFVCWLVFIRFVRRNHIGRIVLLLALALFVLNCAHYVRNIKTFGSPTAQSAIYKNERFGVDVLVSNVTRNIAMHATFPRTVISQWAEKTALFIHEKIGLNPQDSQTSYEAFKIPKWSTNEDVAANPLHGLLIFVACCWFALERKNKNAMGLAVCIVGGFLIFSIILKWQPYHSRLETPLFILGAPLIALLLSKKRVLISTIACLCLFAYSLPMMFMHYQRPLLGEHTVFSEKRLDKYFLYQPDRRRLYYDVSKIINELGCTDVGLIISADGWEYPFWPFLNKKTNNTLTMQHVMVKNKTSSQQKVVNELRPPCAIINIVSSDKQTILLNRKTYVRAWQHQQYAVYASLEFLKKNKASQMFN